MKIASPVPNKDLVLESIDSAALAQTRGGMDQANTTFLVGSLLGIAGYFAHHHLKIRAV